MNAQAKLRVLMIDAAGASVLAACVLACLYLTFFHGEQSGEEIRTLTRKINASSAELAALRAARDQQRTQLKERQSELAGGRQLPLDIPLEEYFQTLSRLVAEHHLRVVRQNPLGPRQYPGLLEQRYAYEVTGATTDIARFLRSVETADFWADVAYLKIDTGRNASSADPLERTAILTLSLFSAMRVETPAPPTKPADSTG